MIGREVGAQVLTVIEPVAVGVDHVFTVGTRVARVADAVPIGVGRLVLALMNPGTAVLVVGDAVRIVIEVAAVAHAIMVRVGLIGIGRVRTVVALVDHAIAVAVRSVCALRWRRRAGLVRASGEQKGEQENPGTHVDTHPRVRWHIYHKWTAVWTTARSVRWHGGRAAGALKNGDDPDDDERAPR